ncbi:MAG: hypothetical protein AAFX09_08940 [Pseudomonadota bacterium]
MIGRAPDTRRKLLSGAVASLAHLTAFLALLAVPPHRPPVETGDGRTVAVRIYTVAGENAVTDAPLNEPPLAGADAQSGSADEGGDGEGEGREQGEADPPESEPEDTMQDAPDSDETASDPVEIEQPDAPETSSATLLTSPGGVDTVQPSFDTDTPQAPTAPVAIRRPAPPVTPPGAPDIPLTTTQDLPEAPVGRRGPPSFAEIAARAAERDDDDRFLIANFAGGVAEVVRDSFCISSSQANRTVFNCVEVPEDLARRLVEIGLSDFAEQPPSFLVDLDRLEFQMRQLGADPPLIEAFLAYMGEARREAMDTPDLARQMGRDRRNASDHLGVGGSVTPQRARDPSGEP